VGYRFLLIVLLGGSLDRRRTECAYSWGGGTVAGRTQNRYSPKGNNGVRGGLGKYNANEECEGARIKTSKRGLSYI